MKRFIQELRRYKLHHLAGWSLLFLGWYYFRYQDYPPRVGWWITLLKVADLALLVYTTNYLLIPALLYKKKYLLFGIVFVSFVFCFSLLKMGLEERLLGRPGFFGIWDDLKTRVYDNVIPHLLLVSTGAAFKLLIDYAHAQRRLGEVSMEKSAAELNFLKSQINPHLLFNSLNAIYFLIDKTNTEARQSLLQFSDLLRYQLYDCNADTIEIEKEVVYLQDYIKLQRLRRDQQYEIGVHIGEGMSGWRITPLLLIPFVENAFKHISHHSDQRNFVQVDLRRDNGLFTFIVENSRGSARDAAMPGQMDGAGGIGLHNVQRRLALLYPEKHQLKILDNDATFKVTLNLHLS